MTPAKPESILVGIEINGRILTSGSLLIQRNVSPSADKSIGHFRYAQAYLRDPLATPVDPVHLPLTDKVNGFAQFGGLPPAVRDASADAWGRSMIERLIRSKGITSAIAEVDYLLTSPWDRSSNLHFAKRFNSKGEPDWDHLAIKTPDLPELKHLQGYVTQAITTAITMKDAGHAPAMTPELMSLITGSGGARPKINIRTRDGMWLVKLINPSNDIASMPRLEAASMDMARICGIDTARTRAERAGEHDLLLVKRFDFDEHGHKRQMISAMTVLGASEDPYSRINWSYPLLAIALNKWSAEPARDKLALFRCMVLRAMLSDRDDHPRNYALIRTGVPSGDGLGQWRLSPMFDCVVGTGTGLKADSLLMDIGDNGGEISRANILSRCHDFGLTREQAEFEIGQIEGTVTNEWEGVFLANGVSSADRALASQSIAPLDERQQESHIARLMSRQR